MRSLPAITLLLALGAGPALADGARLTGLPSALLSGAAAEGTQHTVPSPPVPAVTAGELTVVLGQTRLGDVQNALGGTLQHASDGDASADWLCFVVAGPPQRLLWFVSDGQSGGADRFVTLVGANFPQASRNCDAAPAGLTGLGWPVPDLGAPEGDLEEAFGVVAARDGMVAYVNQSASPGGATTFQSLNYLLADQTVVGLAASQITLP